MPFTLQLERTSERPSAPAPARTQAGRANEDRPTDPAPPVHCYSVPKFPPDPKLPRIDEDALSELESSSEFELPRESGEFPTLGHSTFRPAPIVRHLYQSLSSVKRGA